MPPETRANVPDDRARFTHMLESAQLAQRFVRDRSRSDLDAESMLAFALMRCIEIVGEAAANISDEGRARAPEIEWVVIVNMRHRIVHAYYDINLDILWETVQIDLPPLIRSLERVLTGWESR